jgi:hypothetical protein
LWDLKNFGAKSHSFAKHKKKLHIASKYVLIRAVSLQRFIAAVIQLQNASCKTANVADFGCSKQPPIKKLKKIVAHRIKICFNTQLQ